MKYIDSVVLGPFSLVFWLEFAAFSGVPMLCGNP